jgi:subtilisin family serine protease
MFFPLEDAPPAAIVSGSDEWIDRSVAGLGIESAWKFTRGAGVLVAVLDTGTVTHPCLDANIAYRVGDPDANGHATHVTGIIAACGPANGLVGIAPDCKIASIHAVPGDAQSIADGIDRAVSLGARVINMSLGAYEDDPALHDAVRRAFASDVVMVAAAGNDHPSQTAFPARYPEVIAVSALDANSHEAYFAPNLADILSPNHYAMPGVNILSTWLGGAYARLSGTSQAAPMLSGFAALILADKMLREECATNIEMVNANLVLASKLVVGTTFREPVWSAK